MAREIFRKDALERMASPERVDRPTRLVGASGWLVLAAFLGTLVLGVGWAIGTEAPIKVRAQGILIDRAGLVEMAAPQGGLIEELRLAPGDVVEVGQVVATLSRTELRRELIGAEAQLADRTDRYDRLVEAHRARAERETAADGRRLDTIAETKGTLQGRLVLLASRAEKLAPLAERGVVPELRLIEAQIAVSDLRERIAGLDEQAQTIRLEAAERAASREFELLEDRLAIEEQQRTIARLSARLAEERTIVSSHRGRVVEIKVNPGDVLSAGGALATLAPVASGRDLQALMYVPPADGKRVAPGMAAEIAPTTVEREVYGHIEAEVVSVSPLPATPEGMRRVLQNDQLVEQLSLGGAPIEVRLRLKTDPDTPSGFAWSASQGPAAGVNAGTLLEGRVVIEERPLIDLVIPGASGTLAGALGRAGGGAGG